MIRAFTFLLVIVAIQAFEFEGTKKARAATNFVVTSTADSGPDTLRQAILDANANGNPTEQDTISFEITGSGVKTISLSSALPEIVEPIILDGTTQVGASCTGTRTIVVDIRGLSLPGLRVDHEGTARDYGTNVRGVALRNYNGTGITFGAGNGHNLTCSNIGTDASGMLDHGNIVHGVEVEHGSLAVRIGGNLPGDRNIISGNGQYGVENRASGTIIAGNYIGLAADGVSELMNSSGGIDSFIADDVVIGGNTAAHRNVISGNSGGLAHGIKIQSGDAVTIRNNYIGVTADGSAALGNGRTGIFAASATDAVPVTNLVIRNNVISANTDSGIEIEPGVPGARIISNIIGLDATGTTSLGNLEHGIRFNANSESLTNQIGPHIGEDEQGNVISGNNWSGIHVSGITTGTEIMSNIIGYGSDGTTEHPNGQHGIHYFASIAISGGFIGGLTPSQQNRIFAESPGADIANGILLEETQGGNVVDVDIQQNLIRSEGHAINLWPYPAEPVNVATPNDGPPDADSGPNNLQDFPVITGATAGASGLVSFTFGGHAVGEIYIIEFYASSTCDSDDARQAHRHLVTFGVQTSTGSTVTATNYDLGAAVANGEYLTATAARNTGRSTSELSDCFLVGAPVEGITEVTPDSAVANTPEFEFTVTGTGIPADAVVSWNGTPLATVFNSSTSLTATATFATVGNSQSTAQITVTGSGFAGGPLALEVDRSSSDVNCDGDADALDALDLLKELAGLEANQTACDSNANQAGDADLADVLWIRRETAGLIPNPLASLTPPN